MGQCGKKEFKNCPKGRNCRDFFPPPFSGHFGAVFFPYPACSFVAIDLSLQASCCFSFYTMESKEQLSRGKLSCSGKALAGPRWRRTGVLVPAALGMACLLCLWLNSKQGAGSLLEAERVSF